MADYSWTIYELIRITHSELPLPFSRWLMVSPAIASTFIIHEVIDWKSEALIKQGCPRVLVNKLNNSA
jgi:hypothetical protein